MQRKLSVCILLVASYPGVAFGWNALGHKVVAELAWQRLDEGQRRTIVDVLRRHPRFDADFIAKMEDNAANADKAVQDHWIFQHAATWPDQIRRNKEFDRPIWHYINFPLFLTPSDRIAFNGKVPVNLETAYPGRTPRDEYNILQAIELCRATIRGRATPEVKAVAYCWLFHLVGDVHQPLHSTALFSVQRFPKGDRGGNEIILARGKNLHSLWDNLLGREYYMRNVSKAVAELSDENKYGDVLNSAGKEVSPKVWADESHQLCESFVYCNAILEALGNAQPKATLTPIELPADYYIAAGEHARRRVLASGIRLAGVLVADR